MNLKLIIVFAAVCFAASTMAQSINLRFSTYFYGWQRIDSLSDESSAKTTHIRGYQNLLLEIAGGKWSFNTLAQTEEDLANKIGDGFNYRLYNAYIRGNFDRFDVKLGRQFIYSGVGRGTIDGLFIKLKAGKKKEYQLTAYGGSVAPYTYDFEDYPSISDNYMAGAQFQYYGVKDLMLGLSYVYKRTLPPSYTASRMDSAFVTSQREISFDGPASHLAGFDFNYTYLLKHNFYGKAYFDIQMKKLYRAEVNVRATVADNLIASVGYTYRQPHISYNSIFWVFGNTKENQEIEGGLDYTLKNGLNFYGRAAVVLFGKPEATTISQTTTDTKTNSIKIQAGVTHPMYGLSFIKYMGYTGESDGVYGYYQRQLMKDKLSTSLSLSYSRYQLGEFEYDKVNSLAGALGFTFRPMPQVSIDAQGQILINRIYKTDTRVLVGLSYWLFKNFSRRDGNPK